MSETHSVAGGWLGTYTYRGTQRTAPPVRFEATLAAGDAGRFSGTILDDGKGGEARVDGTQDNNRVRFTKIYARRVGGYAHPVEYDGTLSDDGRTMKGTWHTNNTLTGAWEARRLWSAEGEQETLTEPEAVTRELTTAAP